MQLGHWFDGDGYVTSLVLNGKTNQVHFSGRFVETDRYRAQEQSTWKNTSSSSSPPLAFAGAWTKRGHGKWYENLFQIPKNPANTAVMWLPPSQSAVTKDNSEKNTDPRLFALCEGGHPIELDPRTLFTISKRETPFTSSDRREAVSSFFSAHFSRCPITERIYNHGYILPIPPCNTKPCINVMELSHNGDLIQQKSTNLPYDTFIHDSVITNNYIIYFVIPWKSPEGALLTSLLGGDPYGKQYQWSSADGVYIHVHSRKDMNLLYQVRVPKDISLYHIVDAFDETTSDKATIYVRVAELETCDRSKLEAQFGDPYDSPIDGGRQLMCKLREYTIHCKKDGSAAVTDKDISDNTSENVLRRALCEFPTVNNKWEPQMHRQFCWINAASTDSTPWLHGIQKVDMTKGKATQVKTFGSGTYSGAPAFIPKKGDGQIEDDGYVIATVYDSNIHKSFVVILDAKTLDMICRIDLTHHVPYQFHGEFMPDFLAMM